ncbi:MAG: hypothetical protein NT107_00910 [Planctomycetota bacterium]|nr:hypothetical protein [Planctomycetota bacterium]
MVTSIEAPYDQKKQGKATRQTGKQPYFICAANNANRPMTPLRKSIVLKKIKAAALSSPHKNAPPILGQPKNQCAERPTF